MMEGIQRMRRSYQTWRLRSETIRTSAGAALRRIELAECAVCAPGCRSSTLVIHYRQMSHTITVRLTKELAGWLEDLSRRTGVPQGKIIRDQLERARKQAAGQAFLRLAGSVRGPKDLSSRKGFSRP
jgi:hypothetical protein